MASIRKGLTPYKMRGGAPFTGGVERFLVSNGYATALGIGDPVYVSTGIIRIAANVSAGLDVLTNPGREYGVFMGCKYVNADGILQESTYFPAATSTKGGTLLEGESQVLGYVALGRNMSFLALASASVSALESGALAPITVSSPSAVFKRSTAKINAVVASAGVAHMVRIVGFPNIAGSRPDNAATVVEVEFALPGNPW